MFNHILVCLDGSKLAEEILPYAIAQARRFNARVSVIHVLTASELLIVPTTPTGEPLPSASRISDEKVTEAMKRTEEYLGNIVQLMKKESVDARPVIIIKPFPGIGMVEYAAKHGVDLIAIVTHGYTGLRRAVFGSVADEVLRQSHLPILLIRPDKHRSRLKHE